MNAEPNFRMDIRQLAINQLGQSIISEFILSVVLSCQ
jgi:hypothetical protein